jgi:hypothetical protein
MAEFKIARLRFNWVGSWTDDRFYNRDAVVEYNGKTYVCKYPHTSDADFYTDLYYVNPTTLANEFRWELMLDGIAWKQAWQPNTPYSLGNLVQYGGAVYICIVAHTSGATQITAANWTTYAQFSNWDKDWTVNTAYGINDLVKYGGIVYRCITNHLSAATTAIGIDPDILKWEIVNNGIEFKFDWASTTRYKLNDIVKNGPDAYICTAGHTSGSAFDGTKFTLWMPGTEFVTTWNNITVYQPGDIVMYGGYSYICKVLNTTLNPPSTTSTNWDLLTQGYQISGTWTGGTSAPTYKVGSVVRHHGNLFVATLDNTNQNPSAFATSTTYTASGSSGTTVKVASNAGIVVGMIVSGVGFTEGQTVVSTSSTDTVVINKAPDGTVVNGQALSFIGVNYLYWSLVAPGTAWLGFWSKETDYSLGEIVVWGNGTYRCINAHTSANINRPDNDILNTYWIVYTLHDRNNAGNTPGDIVTRSNNVNVAIPVIEEGEAVDSTEDYVFQVTEGIPAWKEINLVPSVYYVATNGIDRVDYGNSWDHPWASIAYACEQILYGTYNPNASYMLRVNKEFIVEEMYQWMLYQVQEEIPPFTALSTFDEFSTRRDARLVVDALVYDLSHNCNSKTVYAALAYFSNGSTSTFRNTATDAAQVYIAQGLTRLSELAAIVINNVAPNLNYQTINQVEDPVGQIIDVTKELELNSDTFVTDLMDMLIEAITNASTTNIPLPNKGITSTIMVKTGTYEESLPITVPEFTAINGDELRGAVVRPKIAVYTTTRSCDTSEFILDTVEGIEVDIPVQFSAETVVDDFGGVTLGQTYYVESLDTLNKKITIATAPGGTAVILTSGSGVMTVYAGDALRDMFYVRNACGIRNLTLTGLAGSLTDPNSFSTRRPTGGAYVSLDPGLGADDTTTWIRSRSPYIQNVTNFGTGCTGLKIDGSLHNGGNKSIVCNDFTQILSDGIGIWTTGSGALCEAVSVFSYYGYAGYFAEDGGRIRATNGNTSYGTYGVIAEGFDPTEIPLSATVDNQSQQVQATVQNAFGDIQDILSMQYSNAGSNYVETTTNLLTYSNNFLTGWTSDGNVTIQQNITSPFDNTDAWTLTGTLSNTLACYIYQDVLVSPPGAIYTDMTTLNVTGSGLDATVDITVNATSYSAVVNAGGSNYVNGNQLRVLGSQLGGIDGVNDCFLLITSVGGTGGTQALAVTASGTVPTNSNQNYTLSLYVKKGTSSTIDLEARFSGTSTATNTLTFNFDTGVLSTVTSGTTTVTASKLELENSWYRIWLTVYDNSALNNALRFSIYPRGKTGVSGYSRAYGAQVQIGASPSFYLQTVANRPTAYANYTIIGSGIDAEVVADETRSNAVHEVRLTDTGSGTGGRGYSVSSNNSQGGTDQYLIIAGSDTKLESNYLRMRAIIQSGTGAGQYGYISSYDDISKVAQILKESFEPLEVASTNGTTDRITLDAADTTDTLYTDQAIQFIPTYYTTELQYTSVGRITITGTNGGQINQLTVSTTAKLAENMQIRFEGTVFGGVTTNFTYYIKEITSATTFTISTTLFGAVWLLNTASAGSGSMTMIFPEYTNYATGSTLSMIPNMPISFTGTTLGGLSVGTTYYVNDILDATTFTLASTLIEFDVTDVDSVTNYLTTTSTTSLVPLNPIVFSGETLGGLIEGQKYYINKIIGINDFTITSTIITATATATSTGSNLITVSTTAGFVANNPIQFIGNTFGGIISGTTYYILAINPGSFTISNSPGGLARDLDNASGIMAVRTTDEPETITVTESGTMAAATTNTRQTLAFGYGSMIGTYSTNLVGGVTKGTTYYVDTVYSDKTFSIKDDLGVPIDLTTRTGSMKIGAVGWDHINPGTPIESVLDSSSVYYIEPRVTFAEPNFLQTTSTTPTLAIGSSWIDIAYGNNLFMAIPDSYSTAATSPDGQTWTAITLPDSRSWTSVAYGNEYWVIISSGGASLETQSTALVSKANGQGWTFSLLPSKTTWTKVVYGDGIFVAVAQTGANAYSTDYGVSWIAGGSMGINNVTGLCYGAGKFIAVSSDGDAAHTTDATSWIVTTPASASNWQNIAFGNGLFVAVSSTTAAPSYSQDGITWYDGPYEIVADKIAYGQGVFLALDSTSTEAHISEDGQDWKSKAVSDDGYGGVAFGFAATTYDGVFATVAARIKGSVIKAGARTKVRAGVSSGRISRLSIIEPGSNYTSLPTITFTDPNTTLVATAEVRKSNGTLANPTFLNRGSGYNTNSTMVKIVGSGYADAYQTGLTLTVKNLNQLPGPGDNLVIAGNSTIYKVTSATAVFGTTSPNIQANIQLSPDISTELSPAHNAAVTIRTKYSQARLTGHDFLNVGYGNAIQSNYPGVPADTVLAPQDQAVEVNFGRVFYTSTDQDGNFRVGNLFAVEQATGIITLSASQFGLTGLETLSLGGVAVGSASVVVRQFSTDETFIANSNEVIPTQRAIKAYLTNRLSQGGSNTFTGQLIAGTVLVGGPDKISSTIPEGSVGSVVNMPNTVRVQGEFAGWDGDGMAMSFFMKTWHRR